MSQLVLVSENGLHAKSDFFAYNWSCGPYKFAADVMMSRNDALSWSRIIGRKVKLYVGASVVWHGFLSKVQTDKYSVKVSDIYNHLLSDDAPQVRIEDSIDNHGILSAKVDREFSSSDIEILSMPVIRGNIYDLSFDSDKVKVSLQGEGPLLRLNRVIYKNEDAVIAGTNGQVRLGAGEANVWVNQGAVILPFPVNFASATYTVDGATSSGLFEVFDASLTVIASAPAFPSQGYVSAVFASIPAGTAFSVRFTYGGAGAYVVSLGDNYHLGASNLSSFTPEKSMAINLRYDAPLTEVSQAINNYQDMVTVRGRGQTGFIDSDFQKLGDYITNLALTSQSSMYFGQSGFNFDISMSPNDPYNAPLITKKWQHLAPKYQRRLCLNVSDVSQMQGFVVSNWYGDISYKYRRGKGSLSST